MPAEKKLEQVEELARLLGGATALIGTDYSGLTVRQMNDLRRSLRDVGAQYRVVKNRLALIAAGQIGKEQIADILKGPTALVTTNQDPAMFAKALVSHLREARLSVTVTGAVMDGLTLTSEEVETLAILPSREVLLSQALGGLQAILSGLLTVLQAHLRDVATVLQRRLEQLESK